MAVFDSQHVIIGLENTSQALNENHHVGWFDGGCWTLLAAIVEVFPNDIQPYHISRTDTVPDHGVAYIPSCNVYFDADGLQTKSQLFQKMRRTEGVNVQVIAPLIQHQTIYEDIKQLLVLRFSGS